MPLTRRAFLSAATGAAVTSTLPPWAPGAAASGAVVLRVTRRVLEVNGRAAPVFGLLGPGGGAGMTLEPAARFRVRLDNETDVPTLIHWHGQTPPNAQDGVPDVTQPPLPPGRSYDYDFAPRPGTHWMHSHLRLQEQALMAAPMIVRTPEDARADVQEAVLFLHDFTFHDPEAILSGLQSGRGHEHGAGAGGMGGSMPMDLNDVEFDAYLANDRTLDDPEVVRVEPGGRVRLRVINAASSTNFTLDLGTLRAEVVAVDGNPVESLAAARVPIAIAQRVDLMIQVPAGQGAWPVLALREGDVQRTGMVLATGRGHVAKVPGLSKHKSAPLTAEFEARLRAARPPARRPADHAATLAFTGGMRPYAWGIDGKPWGAHEPVRPKPGDRVELTLANRTMMSHPFHVHGHHFQVLAINGTGLAGAVRDTVLVPADGGSVRIAFDADNAGRWVMHCHNLYHMVAGMMTEITYGI